MGGTQTLLALFGKKAQICQEKVKYLGFHTSRGRRQRDLEGKRAACWISIPSTRLQAREFLGATGFCRVWIPSFSVLVTPL